jgi:hypothetical protein
VLLSAEGEDSDKHLEVAAEEWLKARNDYHETEQGITWKTLIDDLKRFLLLNPKSGANRCVKVFLKIRLNCQDLPTGPFRPQRKQQLGQRLRQLGGKQACC